MAHTARSRTDSVEPPVPGADAAAKLFTSICVGLTRPEMMPTTAIRPSGMSLMTVVVVWNLPASLGERALTTYEQHRYSIISAMHSGPITQPPSDAGMSSGKSGQQDVMNTSVYRADSQLSTEVSVG